MKGVNYYDDVLKASGYTDEAIQAGAHAIGKYEGMELLLKNTDDIITVKEVDEIIENRKTLFGVNPKVKFADNLPETLGYYEEGVVTIGLKQNNTGKILSNNELKNYIISHEFAEEHIVEKLGDVDNLIASSDLARHPYVRAFNELTADTVAKNLVDNSEDYSKIIRDEYLIDSSEYLTEKLNYGDYSYLIYTKASATKFGKTEMVNLVDSVISTKPISFVNNFNNAVSKFVQYSEVVGISSAEFSNRVREIANLAYSMGP